MPRMRHVPTADKPNGRCLDGRDRDGLAVERREFDREGVVAGVDVNNRSDVASLQTTVGHGTVSTTRSCSLNMPKAYSRSSLNPVHGPRQSAALPFQEEAGCPANLPAGSPHPGRRAARRTTLRAAWLASKL